MLAVTFVIGWFLPKVPVIEVFFSALLSSLSKLKLSLHHYSWVDHRVA